MKIKVSSTSLVLSLCIGYAAPFQPRKQVSHVSSSALASSYLEGLNGAVTSTPSSYVAPSETESTDPTALFSHAALNYFDVSKMASKGPRATKDWGAPQDATRKLDDDGTFRVGSWYCSEGGWPSPNPKAHTEVFYVLDGHGCLGDADGTRHYFGPGDTVIIPKGHTGRWDVYTPIHKVWAVNDHQRIEETSNPIRVSVTHYHTFAPQYMMEDMGQPLYGFPDNGKSITFYDVGPTKVGAWTCDSGSSFPIANGNKRIFFHLLEGALFVTDSTSGSARRCVAGDTVMLPAGFLGYIDVIESAKKTWTVAE